MKPSVFALLCLLLSVSVALAGSPKKYGKALSEKSVTLVSDILTAPQQFDGKRVRVKGAVVDVCQERGCWIKIASDRESENIRFKVEDGVIVFPLDAKGKDAVAEGVVSVRVISVEDQIAQGEKRAKEEGTSFDKSTVKGPRTIVQISGEGAEIQ
jgi:hypothetical protein